MAQAAENNRVKRPRLMMKDLGGRHGAHSDY
jgi:hypothetical protein